MSVAAGKWQQPRKRRPYRRRKQRPLGGALSPFVNLGMQHDGRRAGLWMKKVTTFCVLGGRQKGFAREHQHGFYET
jgi:hypothetical protein